MNVDLERLKRDHPIVDELARRGIHSAGVNGARVTYRCPLPGHDDANPSFTVDTDKNRFRCYGCDRSGSVLDLVMELDSVDLDGAVRFLEGSSREYRRPAGAVPGERPDGTTPPAPTVEGVTALHPNEGLTLEELCAAKKLEVSFLESLGCRTEKHGGSTRVAIPYGDGSGETRAVRYRVSVTGSRFRWRSGDKALLYGLDRLRDARAVGWVLAVEGESDCWACWMHGVPAIGIPGKTTWRREWADLLAGLDVYVWQEPEAEDLPPRMAKGLPGLRVIVSPDDTKDLSEAHIAGQDVFALVEGLRAHAKKVADVVTERQREALPDALAQAQSVLEALDPLELVRAAIREQGYGGDLKSAELTYLACSGRVLAMRAGSMPAHLLLLGPASAGKSFTKNVVLSLLPPEAYHEIDAGSPAVLIYDDASLEYRVLIFGEADSLPAGEDNPAASAIRNLLQDHHLHYDVTVADPASGERTVRHIRKMGPTTLVTTAVRRLGPQLDTRFFVLEVPDDQEQIASALRAQAKLELQGGAPRPDPALIAYQLCLQLLAPWDVVVPFADQLAEHIVGQPMESRAVRDYARQLTLIKAVAVLRHAHRKRDDQGRLVAEPEDYATVFGLVSDVYKTSSTGAGAGVREAVEAVTDLISFGEQPVTVTKVAARLGSNKMAASRRVRAALKGGWLTNSETRKGYPYHLGIGEPLPPESGLLPPEMLGCNDVTPETVTRVLV